LACPAGVVQQQLLVADLEVDRTETSKIAV
jgi:hypothetical protein